MQGICSLNDYQGQHRKAEIDYWLLPYYWRKGVMREALAALIPFAFEYFKLHRLEAQIETPNPASRNLLKFFNFRHEGTLVDCEIKREAFISLDIYALIQPAVKF